jgi:hypothetical protein
LVADGRSSQLGMAPGQQPLLGVEMAEALGQLALGLCAREEPEALPISADLNKTSSAVALLCPVGCRSQGPGRALLLGIYEQDSPAPASAGNALDLGPDRQQEQLLLIARRLGELLEQR